MFFMLKQQHTSHILKYNVYFVCQLTEIIKGMLNPSDLICSTR